MTHPTNPSPAPDPGSGRKSPVPTFQKGDASSRRKQTLEKIHNLPCNPGPLIEVLQASSHDPDAVTQALLKSPELGARVLSVTNSAAIGVVGEINDIRRAVIHMGANRARAIALAFGLQLLTDQTDADPELTHRLWINSLEKACLAQLVAQEQAPDQADAAYTLGLIQDIGLFALSSIDPVFYSDVSRHDALLPLSEREGEHFGITHAETGHLLLNAWHASPTLSEEVINHHQLLPATDTPSVASLACQIAGILPHFGESLTDKTLDWLTAVHSQFLADRYHTPEDMLRAAAQAAKVVHGNGPSPTVTPAIFSRIVRQVSYNTTDIVKKLWETESLLDRKHEQVNALQFEAVTDPLTQLLNRRGFTRLGERRLGGAVDRGLPVCVISIDMDGFKLINDTYGHDAGDQVLIEFAQCLKHNITSSDLISRLGGDEFALLMVNVNKGNADRIVQRLSDACARTRIDIGGGNIVRPRFSVGVATCDRPTPSTTLASLLAASDEAMYQSKRMGTGEVTYVGLPDSKKAS